MLTSIELLLFGTAAGLAVGLTGGGGALIAVPLLVYVVGLDAPQAVAISLLGVGASSIVGVLGRSRRAEVDWSVGAMLAFTGMLAAPVGASLGTRLPEVILLGAFGLLVAAVAVWMWTTAGRPSDMSVGPCAITRRRSWRCFGVLTTTGLAAGLLSGLFGVGGGFVIVPAVVFATGLPIHRAVATSLMVVSIISVVAFTSMMIDGRAIDWTIATLFLAGGLAGVGIGTLVCHLLPAARLQRAFALLLAAIGLGVLAESLLR